MGRWSHDVRMQMYTFDLVSGLTFTVNSQDQATLSGTGLNFTLYRPIYDKPTAGADPRKDLKEALNAVMKKAALRADRTNEILTQVAIPYAFFAMLLNLQPGRRRYTSEFMSAAMALSGIAVMQFKHHFRVRRPADHSPLIQPLLLTPSHGSFPAGHSTQSYFLLTILNSLVGNAVLGTELSGQMEALAKRIGDNRVVAGVHFPDDVDNTHRADNDGKGLGKALGQYFYQKAAIAGFNPATNLPAPTTPLQWLWWKAQAEWAA